VSLLIRGPFVDGGKASIFVEDGKIAALGEDRAADRTLDAEGLYAFPSLKNGHTHAAMTLFRGYGDDMPLMEWLQTKIWPAELKLTEEDVYHGTRLALLEMIKGGTTYLQDMYWHRDAVARAVEEMGVKGHISSVFIDLGNREMAKEQQDRTIERLAGRDRFGPRVMFALGPHAIYTVSTESLEWAGELASKEGLLLHIHLSETEKEVADCVAQHGLRPAKLLDRLGVVGPNLVAAHGVWLDDEERELLAAAGATVVTNPISNLKLAVGGIFPYRETRAAGLRVALGTDGAASNNNLDLLEEIKVAALVQKHRTGDPTALPAREALGLATTAASEAFGLGPGGIEVGAAADLMLVDLSDAATQPVHEPVSNLVYAASAANVHTTICDGRVLMHDRILEVADEREIIRGAARAARELLARVGAGSGEESP
jgi:5-methylthioadenosine/S-adenosylhomocysteine deaminase